MKSFKTVGLVLSIALCIPACLVVRADDSELDETREALGEMGCAHYGGFPYFESWASGGTSGTSGNPANGRTQVAVPLSCGATSHNWTTSPSASYGTTSCPGQYILEVTNLGHRENSVQPYWAGDALDQIQCIQSRIELGVYKRTSGGGGSGGVSGSSGGGGGGGTWAFVGTQKYRGVWDDSYCMFYLDFNSAWFTVNTTNPGDAIRLAGAAFTGSTKKPVELALVQRRICP